MNKSKFIKFILPFAILAGVASCNKTEELSGEAEILSFSFDETVEANSIVVSEPVIEGNSIKFNVAADATAEQLAVLVPEIKVSEKATVSPASGQAVDFSNGPVTFTVTAQNGINEKEYYAEAIAESAEDPENPDEPDTPAVDVPMEELTGMYKGWSEIYMDGNFTAKLPNKVEIAEMSESSVSVTMKDFNFMVIVNEDITIDDCSVVEGEMPGWYAFKGSQTVTIQILDGTDEAEVSVSGVFKDGGEVSMEVYVSIYDTELKVTYEGARLDGTESSEAEILSFVFDTSVEANKPVTQQPVIEGNEITIHVAVGTTDEQFAAMVPTITVSENAEAYPAEVIAWRSAPWIMVIAEDGTVNTYSIEFVYDEVGFPIDDVLAGTYSGDLTVTAAGSPADPVEASIIIGKASDNSVSLLIENFTFMDIPLGNIQVDECPLEADGDAYVFTGQQDLVLMEGMMNCDVTITEGRIENGTLSLEIDIIAEMMGSPLPVSVTFSGSKN